MKELILRYLDEHWQENLRVIFEDGSSETCKYYGHNYDYDDDGNEVLEIDFERLSDGKLIGTTVDDIKEIEAI